MDKVQPFSSQEQVSRLLCMHMSASMYMHNVPYHVPPVIFAFRCLADRHRFTCDWLICDWTRSRTFTFELSQDIDLAPLAELALHTVSVPSVSFGLSCLIISQSQIWLDNAARCGATPSSSACIAGRASG